MRKRHGSLFVAAALSGVMSLCWIGAVHAAEENTIEAFATWEGRGTLVPMEPGEAVMVATLRGTVYIRSDHGPQRAGSIICPAIAEVSLEDGAQRSEGRCSWTTNDGDRVFAEWTCAGRHLIGCEGDYTLTGGTGRFEGVSGGGPMVLRSEMGAADADPSGLAIERTATGIVFWPALTYTLP